MRKLILAGVALLGSASAATYTQNPLGFYASDKDDFRAVLPDLLYGQPGETVLVLGKKATGTPYVSCTLIRNMGVQADSLVLNYEFLSGRIMTEMLPIMFGDPKPESMMVGLLGACNTMDATSRKSYNVYIPKGTTFKLPAGYTDFNVSISVDSNLKMTPTLTQK